LGRPIRSGRVRTVRLQGNGLAGKVALVTGGASGIGEAISRAYISQGAAVAIVDLNRAAGERLEADLRGSREGARFIECNVADSEAVATAFADAQRHFGGLDVVVNNAGIGSQTSNDQSGWWWLIRINVFGVAWGLREAVRAMRVTGGAIINIGSHAGQRGARAGIYGASKAAVHALTRYSALHHGRDRVRVNSLLPGNIYTPIHDLRRHFALVRRMEGDAAAFSSEPLESGDEPVEARDELLAEFRRIHPMGRVATVEDVAQAAVYLASDSSDMATGNELLVTGGIPPLRFGGPAFEIAPLENQPEPKGVTLLMGSNPTLIEALSKRWERAGLATVAQSEPADGVEVDLLRYVGAGRRLAGIVFVAGPDRPADLLTQKPTDWERTFATHLRLPWVLAHSAAEVLEPGGALTLIADAAGSTGAEGSPAFCAANAALAYVTDDLAELLRPKGIRVNTVIAERTSCLSVTPGGRASASDIADLTFALARLRSVTGTQLSLETSHLVDVGEGTIDVNSG